MIRRLLQIIGALVAVAVLVVAALYGAMAWFFSQMPH